MPRSGPVGAAGQAQAAPSPPPALTHRTKTGPAPSTPAWLRPAGHVRSAPGMLGVTDQEGCHWPSLLTSVSQGEGTVVAALPLGT